MVQYKNPLPEPGELVMCTVIDVQRTHVYLILDGYRGPEVDKHDRDSLNVPDEIRYNAMAYMHISEVANHWIKNIRDFIKEGQKVVCKVLKVDEYKGHIDLSKRRVSDRDKKETIKVWKQANKADGILHLLAEKFNWTLDETYEKVGYPLADDYSDIWSAFEDIKESGIDAIMDLEFVEALDESVLQELEKLVEQNVEISSVRIVGEFELTSYAPNGVEIIKESIAAGNNIDQDDENPVTLSFQLLASPRYRMELEAADYQTAELALKKVESNVLKTIKKLGGEGSFTR
ncbi:MAG: translation initiation factor IF-2 subunit alpha [Candidatus Hodarchaeota archaeon]